MRQPLKHVNLAMLRMSSLSDNKPLILAAIPLTAAALAAVAAGVLKPINMH